jgi:hypothetical protein
MTELERAELHARARSHAWTLRQLRFIAGEETHKFMRDTADLLDKLVDDAEQSASIHP